MCGGGVQIHYGSPVVDWKLEIPLYAVQTNVKSLSIQQCETNFTTFISVRIVLPGMQLSERCAEHLWGFRWTQKPPTIENTTKSNQRVLNEHHGNMEFS